MEEAIHLRDDSEVMLRPLAPDDRERIRRAFDRLSPDSRYRRFFVSLRELSDGLLDVLTDVDHDHEALVGVEPDSGDIVGVARYVRMPEQPERAEASVAVVDDWQGRGPGASVARAAGRPRPRKWDLALRSVHTVRQSSRGRADVPPWPTTSSLQGDLVELDIELPKQGIGAPLATALRAAAGTVLEVQPLAEQIWRRAGEMPGAARLRRPGPL